MSTAPATISALPRTVNLNLYAGDDFGLTVAVTSGGAPADLEDAEVRAHIRPTFRMDTRMWEFEISIADNVIALTLPGSVSAALPNQAVWDCELVQEGRTVTLVAGRMRVWPQVTR